MKTLCFAVALSLALAIGASAQPTASPLPTPPPWLDPFCSVSIGATQWDTATNSRAVAESSDALIVSVFSQSGSRVDAHVTLLSDGGAYDVTLQGLTLQGKDFDLFSPEILVSLPKPTAIRYAYVDSYVLDGRPAVSCPSEPFALPPDPSERFVAPNSSNPRVAAVFKQTLPPLPCGKMFSRAQVVKAAEPVYPVSFFDHVRTTEVAIFLDSNGNLIKTSIYKSSGLEAMDDAATDAAIRSKFKPAMLLCSPVVSKYLFRADFER